MQNASFTAHSPRLIAFYLTQFHPTPENDLWWGKGFSEWTNVTKAKPLFPGHYQPHLPTDFGFYDLRVRETRRDQIQEARKYGIDGFCYHYYWFSGKRLLNAPLDDMLSDPESDMPFCLCWANENWTRRWDAAEQDVLVAQRYLPEDDFEFIKGLQQFFADSRYIRVDGKPLLIVYRPQHLPDAQKTASVWRNYCRTTGVGEIHLCAALTHSNLDYAKFGFDSGVEFPPHNLQCDNQAARLDFFEPFGGYAVNYGDVATTYLERRYEHRNVFRGVCPAWDNTSRTGNRAVMLIDSSPGNYEYWLLQAIRKTSQDFPTGDRFVFINSWNEWAEGCHLEPDRKFGRRFLAATLSAKEGRDGQAGFMSFNDQKDAGKTKRTLVSDLYAVLSYHSLMLFSLIAAKLRKYPLLRQAVRWLRDRLH